MSRNRKKEIQRTTTKNGKKPQKIVSIIRQPADPTSAVPILDREAWMRCLYNKDGNSLAEAYLNFLQHFETHQYNELGNVDVSSVDEFMHMAYMFLTTNLPVSTKYYSAIVSHSHIMQHVAATSTQYSTDAILRKCLSMENNAWRVMAILGPRNNTQVPVSKMFDADPALASMWYNAYILGVSQPTLPMQQHLHNHFASLDQRWIPVNPFVSCPYFTATYFCPDQVRKIKGIMNQALKNVLTANPFLRVNNNPDPTSIAIVTNKWHRNHAVYKSAGPLVEQLVGHYKLTLIHTLPVKQDTLCEDKFDRVCQAYFKEPSGEFVMPPELLNNDFQMIYYPDIGMSNESIWMSNCRLAPIQVMGYGHPDTSGDNSEIDYIIAGSDVEHDSDEFYSEKMVRIPGLSQEPAWPTYERKHNYKKEEHVNINCVWGPDKYNFSMLSVLAQISATSRRRHVFHFFMSPGVNRYGGFIPFKRDVARVLSNVVFHNEQEYYDYMENAEMHDFSINSFPFGGYNTLVESLYLGLPFTTLVGNRFYNRAGDWLLNKIGMPELSCPDVVSFVKTNAALISDPDMLACYRQRLAEMDLKGVLFSNTDPNFLKAIQYILANHPLQESVDL